MGRKVALFLGMLFPAPEARAQILPLEPDPTFRVMVRVPSGKPIDSTISIRDRSCKEELWTRKGSSAEFFLSRLDLVEPNAPLCLVVETPGFRSERILFRPSLGRVVPACLTLALFHSSERVTATVLRLAERLRPDVQEIHVIRVCDGRVEKFQPGRDGLVEVLSTEHYAAHVLLIRDGKIIRTIEAEIGGGGPGLIEIE